MAWQEFNIANIDKGVGKSFEISTSLSGLESSDWYIIPSGIDNITVTLTISNGATAVVQTTTDSIADIKNDNEITAVDWTAGEMTETYTDVTIGRVNAIRCVQTVAGNVKFTVNC